MDDKRALAEARCEKLDVAAKLLGKDVGTPTRWANYTIEEFRGHDEKCPFAQKIDDKLQLMETAGRLTKSRILTYINKDARIRDLKALKSSGHSLPPESQVALVERRLKDLAENESAILGVGGAAAIMTILRPENRTGGPLPIFDTLNPCMATVDCTLEEKMTKSTDLLNSIALPRLLDPSDTRPIECRNALQALEEELASTDFEMAADCMKFYETFLPGLRALIASTDRLQHEYYDDVASIKKQVSKNTPDCPITKQAHFGFSNVPFD